MATPLSAVGISLAKHEILKLLEDVVNAETRVNKKLVDAGQDPLPKAFFLVEEVDELRKAHATELEALKPDTSGWKGSEGERRWRLGNGRRAAPVSQIDPFFGLEALRQALHDDRIDDEKLRALCQIVTICCNDHLDDPARMKGASEWVDLVTGLPATAEQKAKRKSGSGPSRYQAFAEALQAEAEARNKVVDITSAKPRPREPGEEPL